MKKKLIILVLLISLTFILISILFHQKTERPKFRGFGWYGYLADDEINEETLERIKELGGNSVNINVYYEYDPENETFILLSNLTKLEEKVKLAHNYNLKVFLSPFINLVGGHYLANQLEGNVKKYLDGARNISIELAKFSRNNDVEIYAIEHELGLSLLKIPNSTNIVNEWLQNTRNDVDKIYDGILTTKEGVQLGLYRDYNFSGFDYIGVTFYPFTTSYAIDPESGMEFAGVESLEEYEKIVREEYKHLTKLKQKFKNKGIILGEIGIDVVGGKIVGNDDESKKIRTNAYEIVLREGKYNIDGFFFGKFEYDNIDNQELYKIFQY